MRRSNSLFYIILFILTVGIAGQATAGRYYDPAYGRWTTFDPALNEQSPQELLELQNGKLFSHSPYSYGYDNPLKFIDPDGKTPIPWDYLDIGFAVWSVKDFIADPSWSNAGWAVYDVVAAVAPILPSSRYFRVGKKALNTVIKGEKTVPILEGFVKRGDRFYAGSKTVNELGKKLDFSKLSPETIRSTKAKWKGKETGGVNRIVAYKDKDGNTIAVIHEVTNSKGKIVHRDFDSVRLESGQMINKDKTLDNR